MSPFALVALREFRERVTSRAFVLSTLLLPVFSVVIVVLPTVLVARAPARSTEVVVVDQAPPGLADALVAALHESGRSEDGSAFTVRMLRRPLGEVEADLRRDVLSREVDGYLWLPPDVADGGRPMYRARNISNFVEMGRIQSAVTEAVRLHRFQQAGVAPDRVAELLSRVDLDALRIAADGRAAGGARATLYVGFGVAFTLYMLIALYGSAVMLSVLEEKTSRVVEVVLSSVHPTHLMIGKMLGVGAAVLTQVGIWALIGAATFAQGAAVVAALSLPPDTLDALRFEPWALLAMLVFFAVGFFQYSAVFAAIGALANTQQEAQQYSMLPVSLLMLPLLCGPLIAASPEGPLAMALAQVPFTSPMVMPLRLGAGDVPAWELALSVGLLVLGTGAVAWLSGRIYRVGILATGSRPGVGELWRWIRTS